MVWEEWDPFMELERMRKRIDNMMGGFTSGVRTKVPAIDMWKTNGNLIIETDMPGISKDDINLMLTKNSLSVSAQKKKVKKEEKEGVYRSERRWKSYKRSANLPVKVNPKKAKADYKDGTLKIKAPIAGKEKKKGVKVKVK